MCANPRGSVQVFILSGGLSLRSNKERFQVAAHLMGHSIRLHILALNSEESPSRVVNSKHINVPEILILR